MVPEPLTEEDYLNLILYIEVEDFDLPDVENAEAPAQIQEEGA